MTYSYQIRDFTCNKGVLVAEASTLEIPVECIPSKLNINGTFWYYDRLDYCDNGEDVAGFRYKPTMGASQAFPGIREVLIIND